MNKFRRHALCLFSLGLVFISGQANNNIKLFENYPERDRTTRTIRELFYGMSQDSSGNYYDSELDSIGDLLHKEYNAEWKNQGDSTSFIMSVGLYIYDKFPNKTVERTMLAKVDSVLTEDMAYHISENELKSRKPQMATLPDSLPLFIDLWNNKFDRWTKMFNLESSENEYQRILDSRVSLVCHRIYEDAKWVTYILESSVNYHGSSGCPSSAEYFTIDKHSGHILSKDDILKEGNLETIYNLLPKVYVNAARAKGFPPQTLYDGEELLQKADGVALINEGLLFYYLPYTIGCGAEEQYNLVLPLD